MDDEGATLRRRPFHFSVIGTVILLSVGLSWVGARVLQAQGKTIIPALFDRDTHISQQGEAIIRYLGDHFGL